MRQRFVLAVLLLMVAGLQRAWALDAYAVLKDGTVTFYYDNLKNSRDGVLEIHDTYGTPYPYKAATTAVFDALIEEHRQDPGLRVLQKKLAEELTVMVHSREDYEAAVEASGILFGKSTKESLVKLDEQTLLDVFSGVPQFEISKELLAGEGTKAVDLFAEHTQCFPSKGEMRKLTQGGGVSLNKEKLASFDQMVTEADLLDGKYLLVQQGKKKYFLLIAK